MAAVLVVHILQAWKPDMRMLALFMMMVDGGAGEVPEVQLLDFSASYCQPCKQMVPTIQAMERDGFPVRQIDITEEHELARRFQVDRVPTLVLLVQGKEVRRFVGLTSGAELRREMNNAARKLAEARGLEPAETVVSNPDNRPEALMDSDAQADPEVVQAGNDLSDGGPKRTSMGQIFHTLMGKGGRPGSFERPTVRAQSPENSASLDALKLAFAATVRVKVTGTRIKDGLTVQDVGTGTIVHSGQGQAIVLTCAHLFLGVSKDDSRTVIEVFENGKSVTYPGAVIGGDHNSDIAFLKFQTSKTLPAVALSASAPKIVIGQELMSFGCNDGADPTPMETKLVEVNRYEGPANLVCSKDPQGGRSGGGLFTGAGEIVGICSCADRKRIEGLYMSHPAILQLVEKLKLTALLRSSPAPSIIGGEDAASTFSQMLEMASSGEPSGSPIEASENPIVALDNTPFQELLFDDEPDDATAKAIGTDPILTADTEVSSRLPDGSGMEPEITIEINDRSQGGRKRVIVIPRASPWMLELLTGETASSEPASATAALRPVATTRETTSRRTSPADDLNPKSKPNSRRRDVTQTP